MVVFDPDGTAYVEWELACSRSGEYMRVPLNFYLSLLRVTKTEAELRARLFSSEFAKPLRTEEMKERRKAANKL